MNFSDIFIDDTKNVKRINSDEYLIKGSISVIDQGKELIAGYASDDVENACYDTRIIFGDHTRIFKYIDFPFVCGADGTKVLKIIDPSKINYKYMYYYLLASNIPNTGYNRHFKWVKELSFKPVDINSQMMIVNKLDKINNLIDCRKKEIEKCDNLIKSQFVEMFGDPKTNKKGWIKASMGEYMTVLTDFSSNGSYKTLDSTVTMYDEPNYAYMVRTTDLENEDYKNNVKYITEEAYNFLAKSKVYPNDIIMNKIGSAGKVYIMPDVGMPVSLGRNAFLFRYSEKIEPVFIYYLLKSEYGVNEISQYVRGAVTKTITKDDARKVKIIVPPIELQKKFTQIVEQIDKQKFVNLKIFQLLGKKLKK